MAYNSTLGLQENFTFTKLNIQGKQPHQKAIVVVIYFQGFRYIAVYPHWGHKTVLRTFPLYPLAVAQPRMLLRNKLIEPKTYCAIYAGELTI
jgi:hypothetical protein